MKTLDLLGISVSSLTANPIRTFLTMLGVVIGVACVVSMVAIGAGAQARVADQIRAFGANVLLELAQACREVPRAREVDEESASPRRGAG